MPFGYLASVLILATCVACALTSPRRPRRLAMISYFVSVVVNEVPLWWFVLLVAWTVPAIAEDALLATGGGWAVLALALLTSLGLAQLARRAMTARDVVQRAVAEGLGAASVAGTGPHVSRLRALLLPLPLKPRAVQRIANLSYGPGGRRHRMDVYRHRSRPAGAPVLIYLHGGGYFSGGKHREARELLHRMAARGWVCVSADYRLRPAAGFPDHLIDAKRAIATVRELAPDHGADPARLVVSGSSAGGHLAALAAVSANDPALQPGFEAADTSVSAVVGLYGYYGRYYGRGRDENPVSTPLGYDVRNAPPFFLAHGKLDSYVPVEGARRLAEKLRSESANPLVYAELPGAQHGFDVFRSVRFAAVVDGIEQFTAAVLAPVDASSATARAPMPMPPPRQRPSPRRRGGTRC